MPVAIPHGRGDGGGLVVGLSMHRWAMYGGGEDLVRVADVMTPWLLGAADRLGADTGYATLGRLTAEDSQSPWERATHRLPALRDVTRTLWGYGWGTLLSPVHVEAVGGRAVLWRCSGTSCPPCGLRDAGGGRTWLTLGEDPATVRGEDVRALRGSRAGTPARDADRGGVRTHRGAGRGPRRLSPTWAQRPTIAIPLSS